MSILKKLKKIFKKKPIDKPNTETTEIIKKEIKTEPAPKPKKKPSSRPRHKPKYDSSSRGGNKPKDKNQNTRSHRNQNTSRAAQRQPEKIEKAKKQVPFTTLGLDPKIIKLLNKNNFKLATLVQEKSIPVALNGHNIFCSSETGSGKTLSFLLPMIHKLINRQIDQGLIVCPTREIAIQTQKVLQTFNDGNLKSALVIGGTDMAEQKKALHEYPNILVATPGRLLDMLGTGLIWLEYTGYVVLDEADRMLDMGFEEDLIKIHNELSGDHQTLLYSATLFPQVKKMAQRYASDYKEVIIGSPRSIVSSVEHVLVEVNEREKFAALKHLLLRSRGRTIVFFNTIKETDAITRRLKRDNVRRVNCIHSKRDQAAREQIIFDFRAKKFHVLLASDVAARGIDIPNVELVINYDLPNNKEEYIHRVGRTGRAGKTGKAISFFSPKDRKKLCDIERLIKSKIERKQNYRSL